MIRIVVTDALPHAVDNHREQQLRVGRAFDVGEGLVAERRPVRHDVGVRQGMS